MMTSLCETLNAPMVKLFKIPIATSGISIGMGPFTISKIKTTYRKKINTGVKVQNFEQIGLRLRENELDNFSFEKTLNDKSWDITTDLKDIAQLIFNENNFSELESIKDYSLKDFERWNSRALFSFRSSACTVLASSGNTITR